MMNSQQVMIELPLPLFHFLERLAAQTSQPLEKLVAQSVAGNLPPSVDNAPLEAQAGLLALQSLSIDELREIAHEQVSPERQKHHFYLLAQDNLTADEQAQLAELRRQADQLMLRQAYAWAVLRWRGHPIPRLDEIPIE